MTQKEMLEKTQKIYWQDIENVPLLSGIFIIQQRKLHDSGYRLMYVIGHDEKFENYYLLDECSDVVNIESYWTKVPIEDVHIDINKNGIIHIWGRNKYKCTCALSSCSFDVKE